MKMVMRARVSAIAILVLALTSNTSVQAQNRIGIEDRFADVNGVRIHYLISGKGDAVILMHGYAETSRMWRPLMVELAKTNTVIAPDLRGFGQSSTPSGGYEKKTMAQDVHALAMSLGYRPRALSATTSD
jgi:pimeloyl-ACP methyl ester carboxylesterase